MQDAAPIKTQIMCNSDLLTVKCKIFICHGKNKWFLVSERGTHLILPLIYAFTFCILFVIRIYGVPLKMNDFGREKCSHTLIFKSRYTI